MEEFHCCKSIAFFIQCTIYNDQFKMRSTEHFEVCNALFTVIASLCTFVYRHCALCTQSTCPPAEESNLVFFTTVAHFPKECRINMTRLLCRSSSQWRLWNGRRSSSQWRCERMHCRIAVHSSLTVIARFVPKALVRLRRKAIWFSLLL